MTMLAGIAHTAAISYSLLAKPNDTASPSKPAPPSVAKQLMQDALTALKVLTDPSNRSSASGAAKADAKQKLDVLKAQLKTLMLMGGSPRQRASQAAAIAKEIAAAAKAYSQADGGASMFTVPTPGVAPADVAAHASHQDPPGGSTKADAGATASPANIATVSPAPSEAGKDPTANATSLPARGDSDQADKDFIKDVTELSQQVKSIIKATQQALKRQGGTLDIDISRAADAALVEVKAAIDAIGAPPTVGYDGGMTVTPAPAISITA